MVDPLGFIYADDIRLVRISYLGVFGDYVTKEKYRLLNQSALKYQFKFSVYLNLSEFISIFVEVEFKKFKSMPTSQVPVLAMLLSE